MQRLILLLGDPVYAFAVTLAAFLVFAGIGSGVAAQAERRAARQRRTMVRAPRRGWRR